MRRWRWQPPPPDLRPRSWRPSDRGRWPMAARRLCVRRCVGPAREGRRTRGSRSERPARSPTPRPTEAAHALFYKTDDSSSRDLVLSCPSHAPAPNRRCACPDNSSRYNRSCVSVRKHVPGSRHNYGASDRWWLAGCSANARWRSGRRKSAAARSLRVLPSRTSERHRRAARFAAPKLSLKLNGLPQTGSLRRPLLFRATRMQSLAIARSSTTRAVTQCTEAWAIEVGHFGAPLGHSLGSKYACAPFSSLRFLSSWLAALHLT